MNDRVENVGAWRPRWRSLMLAACSGGDDRRRPLATGRPPRSANRLSILGWNVSVSNLRFDGDQVLIDVDAARRGRRRARHPRRPCGSVCTVRWPIRSRPMPVGGCASATRPEPAAITARDSRSASAAQHVLGPIRDQSQVRGCTLYSPQDRMPRRPRSPIAAAFPVGLAPTSATDTGCRCARPAWTRFTRRRLATRRPPRWATRSAFTGNGYMLLGLAIDGLANAIPRRLGARGGPMMVLTGPTLPGAGSVPCLFGVRLVAAGAARRARATRCPGPGVDVHPG